MIARNVKGCPNSGLCGLDCPDQRQAIADGHSIPAALDMGATLISKARALRLRQIVAASAVLDYPLSDFLTEGARKVIGHVFDIHFAAGARNVSP